VSRILTLALLPASAALLLALPGGSFASPDIPTTAEATNSLLATGSLVGNRQVGDSFFGASTALSADGRVALVGAPHDGRPKGAAWIFRRSGSTWARTIKLTGSGKSGEEAFGSSVSLSANGRIALVGAPGDPFGNKQTGAAWIYTTGGGGAWVGRKLTARGESGNGKFGSSVALSADGTTALIGGPSDNRDKGAVWVFTRSGSTWRQTGNKLTGKGEIGKGRFGASVAIAYDRSTALVGGPGHDGGKGAAWVFTRSGSVWKPGPSIVAKLRSGFGESVALSGDGDTALIGGPAYRYDVEGTGAAWIYRRQGSTWSTKQMLLGTPERDLREKRYRGGFGSSVVLSSDGLTALIGGHTAGVDGKRIKGAAWVFGRSASSWSEQQPVLATYPNTFGDSLALSEKGTVALIGRFDDDSGLRGGGVSVLASIPFVKRVDPRFGPNGGGTRVTITGENFFNVRAVRFGSRPAASFTVASRTKITAVSPAAQAENVHIRVTTPLGTSPERQGTGGWFASRAADLFTYVSRPIVAAISPTSGPTSGGTEVTITGDNFAPQSVVRFGTSVAASARVLSPTEIRAISPTAQAGTVDVTVMTVGGISATSAADRFTYVVTQKVINFDDLTTGGPGGALVTVDSQYAGQGVTFNSVKAIDYSKGSAIPGFARSGTVGIEQCVGIEFCTTPIRATFSAPQRLVRVYVGFSFALNQPLQVQLTALNGVVVVGTASATLPANASPTPIRTALEVQLGTASITSVEVSVPGGYNSALAVDDVTFEGAE